MNKLSLKNFMKKKKRKGFTLVELIIVIAIIAILVAIAVPKFGQITKNANIKADMASAKTIHGLVAESIAEGNNNVTEAEVAGRLDGTDGTNLPQTKLDKNTKFRFEIDGDKNIRIYAGTGTDNQIYPKQTGTYSKASSTSKTEETTPNPPTSDDTGEGSSNKVG